MNKASRDKLFRQAAIAEGGMPISAGARLSHVRQAIEAGRAYLVDLSAIEERKRPDVIGAIKKLLDQANPPGPSRRPGTKPKRRP